MRGASQIVGREFISGGIIADGFNKRERRRDIRNLRIHRIAAGWASEKKPEACGDTADILRVPLRDAAPCIFLRTHKCKKHSSAFSCKPKSQPSNTMHSTGPEGKGRHGC